MKTLLTFYLLWNQKMKFYPKKILYNKACLIFKSKIDIRRNFRKILVVGDENFYKFYKKRFSQITFPLKYPFIFGIFLHWMVCGGINYLITKLGST